MCFISGIALFLQKKYCKNIHNSLYFGSMRNLQFKYASAHCFLPFGSEGIEFNFEKMGQIVLVRGQNLDVKPIENEDDDKHDSSNGCGKSSWIEILSYCLYGKTIKKPKKVNKDDVVHNLIGKGCKLEVIWDKYKVIRTRKPDGLSLFEWDETKSDWHDITAGGIPATQKEIEKKLGFSYESFLNVCVFTDDNEACFLNCDTPTKREIVENLLSLGIYRERHQKAKDLLKTAKDTIKSLSKEYDNLLAIKSNADRRVEQTQQKEADWKKQRQSELNDLISKIKTKKSELEKTDSGTALTKYLEAQERIKEINAELPSLEELKAKQEAELKTLNEKETKCRDQNQVLVSEIRNLQSQITNHKTKIDYNEKLKRNLESEDLSAKCQECNREFRQEDKDNDIAELDQKISTFKQELLAFVESANTANEKATKFKTIYDKLKQMIKEASDKFSTTTTTLKKFSNELISCSQVREPKAESSEQLIQQQIESLKSQATAKKAELEGPSPYVDLLTDALNEVNNSVNLCAAKKLEIQTQEADVPYYEYYCKAFGDNGIRKWVVDGIIPALNARIAYWLQFLIDNKIQLKFDNQLEETIERNPPDGNPYVYSLMSAGQKRRLNLAISQAFAYVMMCNTGTVPSLVFLDEVSTNIDPNGVQGLYSMICELAQEKQVFVTTHDQDLLKLLDGAENINLVMENGFTKIVN